MTHICIHKIMIPIKTRGKQVESCVALKVLSRVDVEVHASLFVVIMMIDDRFSIMGSTYHGWLGVSR
jgi:hypothetical protein